VVGLRGFETPLSDLSRLVAELGGLHRRRTVHQLGSAMRRSRPPVGSKLLLQLRASRHDPSILTGRTAVQLSERRMKAGMTAARPPT
jgi:hypothetical protein